MGHTQHALALATAGASHPAVAVWFGLVAAALAGAVVAMAWNVHARQIRLAEVLARRQFIVTGDTGTGELARGTDEDDAESLAGEIDGDMIRPRVMPEAVIDGPDQVVAGEQARYRVRAAGGAAMVSWSVGGGSVSQTPDPAHPDELLLIAEQPGDLTITVRVREGLAERRETKTVTAVPDVTTATPPFTLRLFLHGWGLVAVAVLVVGFAGALDALGNFTSSDFIALVVPLAALLGVIAVARGPAYVGGRPGPGKGHGPL